jgi:hypothetical protein
MENPAVVAAVNDRPSVIDWAAILAGAVLAAGIGIVLNAFGAALGLDTLSVGDAEGSFNLWLGLSGFWMVVTLVLTYLAGGYVAGRMRRRGDGVSDDETSVRDGVHGLVVWALGMIAMAWMAVSLLGAAASTVGAVVGKSAEVAGSTLAAGVEATVQDQAMAGQADTALLRGITDRLSRSDPAGLGASATGIDPTQLIQQSASILADVARTGEISDEDRRFLTAATIRVSGVTSDVAEARTDAAISAAQELRAKVESLAASAKSDALTAAEATRKGAILTAFLLAAASLAAAAAAVAGGVYGGAHRDENRFFSGFTFRR